MKKNENGKKRNMKRKGKKIGKKMIFTLRYLFFEEGGDLFYLLWLSLIFSTSLRASKNVCLSNSLRHNHCYHFHCHSYYLLCALIVYHFRRLFTRSMPTSSLVRPRNSFFIHAIIIIIIFDICQHPFMFVSSSDSQAHVSRKKNETNTAL